jgi:hypothetical protein
VWEGVYGCLFKGLKRLVSLSVVTSLLRCIFRKARRLLERERSCLMNTVTIQSSHCLLWARALFPACILFPRFTTSLSSASSTSLSSPLFYMSVSIPRLNSTHTYILSLRRIALFAVRLVRIRVVRVKLR